LFVVAAELTPTFSPMGSRKKVILETALVAIFVVTVAERVVQVLR